MTEIVSINLDPAIKRLVKENDRELFVKAPAIKALAICAEQFMVEIVDEAAKICLEKQKNTMTEDHFYEALEKRRFTSIVEDAKTKGKEITDKIKQRNESWKGPTSGEKMSHDEAVRAATQDREAVLLELKRRKQAEAAKAALNNQ